MENKASKENDDFNSGAADFVEEWIKKLIKDGICCTGNNVLAHSNDAVFFYIFIGDVVIEAEYMHPNIITMKYEFYDIKNDEGQITYKESDPGNNDVTDTNLQKTVKMEITKHIESHNGYIGK